MRSWYCEVMINMGHGGWVFVDYRCLVVRYLLESLSMILMDDHGEWEFLVEIL